jgi:hypothetical protein
MYALIIVIAVLSPAGGAVTPVGVTSQVVGKFKDLDQCKAAASQQSAGGAISDLSLSRGSTGTAHTRARGDLAEPNRSGWMQGCPLMAQSGHP